jgi:hypothetical protein
MHTPRRARRCRSGQSRCPRGSRTGRWRRRQQHRCRQAWWSLEWRGRRGGRTGCSSPVRCIRGAHAERGINRCRRGGHSIVEKEAVQPVWGKRRRCGPGTHCDERKGATRVDRDAMREVEQGAGAVAVAEAWGAADERGGRPGGDVDAADAVVVIVLRCIMEEHTDQAAKQMTRCGGGHEARLGGRACVGVETACAGEDRTATSANVPLGSIATATGRLNWALAPSPSRKPAVPLVPASVVVAQVARSTRRMLWLKRSCEASHGRTHAE